MYVTIVVERSAVTTNMMAYLFRLRYLLLVVPDVKSLLDEKKVRREECKHQRIPPIGGWMSKGKF